MSEKKTELNKVLNIWDILVLAFGAMIGWAWVVIFYLFILYLHTFFIILELHVMPLGYFLLFVSSSVAAGGPL